MSHKIKLINNIHKMFRTDPYINEILKSGGDTLDFLDFNAIKLGKEFWFDTMSAVGIAMLESQLDYDTMSKNIEGKREELEARWKTSGKCDLKLLQVIADSWRNGQVSVLFTNSVIEITFISLVGIPRDLEVLKAIIEEAKPAHLPINYTFRYRVWGMLIPNTWEYYKKYTWEEVMKKEEI